MTHPARKPSPLTKREHESLYGSAFFRIPNVLIDNMAALDIAPVDLTILAIFMRHRYRRDSEIRPSFGSIQKRTGLSRRTIGVRVNRFATSCTTSTGRSGVASASTSSTA
jgi:hypothetical protein